MIVRDGEHSCTLMRRQQILFCVRNINFDDRGPQRTRLKRVFGWKHVCRRPSVEYNIWSGGGHVHKARQNEVLQGELESETVSTEVEQDKPDTAAQAVAEQGCRSRAPQWGTADNEGRKMK